MEIPRSSSDFAFAYPCRTCLGNGGFGLRRADKGGGSTVPANFTLCTSCNGSGWTLKRPKELTPEEAEKIRGLLREIPADPEVEHNRESIAECISSVLSGRHIESVRIPEGDAVHIDIVCPSGSTVRIMPEFRSGRFHNLIAIPQPPEP